MPLPNVNKRIKRNISKKLGLMGVAGSGGGGGKGGKSSGRSAQLLPPTATDLKQTIAVAGSLDLLCEGPIGGTVNPRGIYTDSLGGLNVLQSVYLNDVSVLESSENIVSQKTFIQNTFLLHTSHSGTTFDMEDTGRYDIQFYCEDDFLKYLAKEVNLNKDLIPLGELEKTMFCFVGKPSSSSAINGSEDIPANLIPAKYNDKTIYDPTVSAYNFGTYFFKTHPFDRFFSKKYRRGFAVNYHAEAVLNGYGFRGSSNLNFIFNSVFIQQTNQRTISGAQYQNFKYNISGSGITEPQNLNDCISNYTGNADKFNLAIYDSKQLFDRGLYNLGVLDSYITNLPALSLTKRRKPNSQFMNDIAIDPVRAFIDPEDVVYYYSQAASWPPFYSTRGEERLFSSLAYRKIGYNVQHNPNNPILTTPLDLSDLWSLGYSINKTVSLPHQFNEDGTYYNHRETQSDYAGAPPNISDDSIFIAPFSNIALHDYKYPRISGNKYRFYDPASTSLGGASSRETTPLMVENFQEDFLNGYYLRSGGHIFRTVDGFIDESNIYSDRKIRNQTNAINPYEHNTKFVNRYDLAAYMETGLTPNNTTGWILKYSGVPYYYFDNCVQKKFNYNGEEGYDLYSPQQFSRREWTGSLEFTHNTALSLTGSPEFTQFQNDNSQEYSGGWTSYNGRMPGNVVSILGTGYGDWKINSWTNSSDIKNQYWNVHVDYQNFYIHYDNDSGISLDSKVSVGGLYQETPTGNRIEFTSLRDFLSMEVLVSGEIKYILGDCKLRSIFNQNPALYDGTYSNTIYDDENIEEYYFGTYYHFQHFPQTSYKKQYPYTEFWSTYYYGQLGHLTTNRDAIFIKNGEFLLNDNGDICFASKNFLDKAESDEYDFIKSFELPDLDSYRDNSPEDRFNQFQFSDKEEIINPFEEPLISSNVIDSYSNIIYSHNAFQKLDGIADASIAGKIAIVDLNSFSQTLFNYDDVFVEFRNGEEQQEKISTFAESKTENNIVSDLYGPFQTGGDARDGDGNADIRSVGAETINYAAWTNELPINEDEISYKYIIDRSEVVKVECIIRIDALQETTTFNSIIPSEILFELEVGFDGLDNTTKTQKTFKGLVDPSSPFITNLSTIDLPSYSEIQSQYPDKSLPFLKENHKRYVIVRKKTYETESILVSRSASVMGFNEIIDSNFTYPNSALAAIYFDSKTFTDPPKRTYDLRLKKCQIPSNYFPLEDNGLDKRFLTSELDTKKQIYSGDWDGSFKEDWTDNPAWILYDILTNNSYGLGDYQDDIEDIDIFKLYQIGKYCDAVDSSGYFSGVSDNKGGLEPRHSCNILFEESFNGFDFVNAVCNMFQGVAYWKNGSLNFFADKPESVSAVFGNSDVFDGVFSYTDLNKNERFNLIEIQYKDKDDNYKTKIEYIEDEESIRKNGIIKYQEGARGITSSSQARRYAKYILYTNKLENESVNFRTSQQSLIVEPGDVIGINDELKNFQEASAKLLDVDIPNNSIKVENVLDTGSISTGDGVYLYTPIDQQNLNDLYTGINFHNLMINDSSLSAYESPQIVNIDITGINQSGNYIEFLLNGLHEDIGKLDSAVLGQFCNFRINGYPEHLYRVISIIPSEDNLYEIVGRQYNPIKYQIMEQKEGLENNQLYELPNIGLPSNIINRPPAPQGFSFSTGENNMYSINLSGLITGELNGIEEKYRVSVTKPNGMYFSQDFEKDSTLSPPQTYFEFNNLIGTGQYKIEVTSLLNPESSEKLEKFFTKEPTLSIYESPFLDSVKIGGNKYEQFSNIASVQDFGKDLSIDFNFIDLHGLPYKDKSHININLLQGGTGYVFDVSDFPVSITEDERRQLFGTAERNFKIQSFLDDGKGNIYPSPEIEINYPIPEINEIRTVNNQHNLKLEVDIEHHTNIVKIDIYSGQNSNFEISQSSFLKSEFLKTQKTNEIEFGHQKTGEIFYSFVPYDCFGSGIVNSGYRETINFPEPVILNNFKNSIHNTLFLNTASNTNGEFIFSDSFQIPKQDFVLKIGGEVANSDCVLDIFLNQFSGRFELPFNNGSFSESVYFTTNPFKTGENNLFQYESSLSGNSGILVKLVSGDLNDLDLEIKGL